MTDTPENSDNHRRRVKSHPLSTRVLESLLGHGSLPPLFVGEIRPDVPEKKDADNLLLQMKLCLDHGGGEVRARTQTVALGQVYGRLSEKGREKFFYMLATEFDRDHDRVRARAEDLLKAPQGSNPAKLEEALKDELVAPRITILQQFLSLPNGARFLIDMRGDLLRQIKTDSKQQWHDVALKEKLTAATNGMEGELKTILTEVFDPGLLHLDRITVSSPPELVEKVQRYELVHDMKSHKDVLDLLKRKDRRIYAFFHPKMPDEPFLVLNVKFARRMESSIQKVRGDKEPEVSPRDANTVLFDSISNPFAANPESGLSGTGIANFLIKEVAGEIEKELPNVRTFATLSPIQDFRKWLEPKLVAGDESLLRDSEIRDIKKRVTESSGNAAKDLLTLLNGGFQNQPPLAAKLEPIMERLAARYLLLEERGTSHAALDSVASFHLKNGAQVERVNWLGDVSERGMKRSWGMTVNYVYNLRHVDENHESYMLGTIMASPAVRRLAALSNGVGVRA